VRALSRNEIKKDLYEIEYYDNKSDSESVCSAASDDVLTSSYPVKPRRHPRVQRDRTVRPPKDTTDQDSNSVESAIEFLRVVETARPEIFEAEKKREDLEIRYEVCQLFLCISPRCDMYHMSHQTHTLYLYFNRLSKICVSPEKTHLRKRK
jgi:hypothetical protein